MAIPANVKPLGGPGSQVVSLEIDLGELRTQLIRVGHPLGSVPQWVGSKVWLIEARATDHQPHVMVIQAPTDERAQTVALANLKTRGGPEWEIRTCQEVKFGSQQLLLNLQLTD